MPQKSTKEFENHLKSKVTEIINDYQRRNEEDIRQQAEAENARRLGVIDSLLQGWFAADAQYVEAVIQEAQEDIFTRLVDDLRINGTEPNLRTPMPQAEDDEEPDLIKAEEESESESPKVKSPNDLANSKAGEKVKTASVKPKSTFTNATLIQDCREDKPPEKTKLTRSKTMMVKKVIAKLGVPVVKDKKISDIKTKKLSKLKPPSIGDDHDEDHEDQDDQKSPRELKSMTTPKIKRKRPLTPVTLAKTKRAHGVSSPDGVKPTSNKRVRNTPDSSKGAYSTPSKTPTSKKPSQVGKISGMLQKDKNEGHEARDGEHELSEDGEMVPKMTKKREGGVRR